MGQKVTTTPVDKDAQDLAKYRLYVLMLKLLGMYVPDYEGENYN